MTGALAEQPSEPTTTITVRTETTTASPITTTPAIPEPVPGENLPKMPCIPPKPRRRRETTEEKEDETKVVGKSLSRTVQVLLLSYHHS